MRLRVCHDGRNRNGSAFSLQGFEAAKDSIRNIPILGHVLFDEDGQPQFGGHDYYVRTDSDGKIILNDQGEPKFHYEEVPIGLIPESCNYAIEEYKGRRYVCVDALIWRDYANEAEDIIERDQDIQLSMETDILDAEFDRTYGVYNVTNFVYRAVTYLGNDHLPAMADAGATIAQYTQTKREHFDEMWFALQSDLQDNVNETEANTLSEEIKNQNVEETEFDTNEPETVEEHSEENEAPEQAEDKPAENHETVTEGQNSKKAYSLLSNIVDSIGSALSTYTYEYDGMAHPKYYFEDIDPDKQLAYVYSMEDGHYYSVPYAVEGDSISLIHNFTRQVLSYRDFVVGQDTDTNFSDGTRGVVAQEAYSSLKKSYEESQKELEELRTYRAQIEAEKKQIEVEAVFQKFEDLAGNAEFEALKEKAADYEVADLEKECYALRGKNIVPNKFSASKSSGLRVPLGDYSQEAPVSRVAEMIEKFQKG